MIIRPVRPVDDFEINRIYNKWFSDNEYPNFSNPQYQCSFVVTNDDSDKIIVAGGVKTIAEAVVVTDKSLPVKTRLDALLQALGSSIFIAQGMKQKQIHAFVNHDDRYVSILRKFGFKEIDAKLLVLDFGDFDGQTQTA